MLAGKTSRGTPNMHILIVEVHVKPEMREKYL